MVGLRARRRFDYADGVAGSAGYLYDEEVSTHVVSSYMKCNRHIRRRRRRQREDMRVAHCSAQNPRNRRRDAMKIGFACF